MALFEWDEAKRQIVVEKHGLDFVDAIEIFEHPHLVIPARSEAEERQMAVGQIGGITIAVIFTMRGDVTRLITARRARRNERESYETHIARRDPTY